MFAICFSGGQETELAQGIGLLHMIPKLVAGERKKDCWLDKK